MNKKEMEMLAHAFTINRVLCKCSHSVIIPFGFDKVVCSWCGNYVFRDKKAEFKYRIKEKIKRCNDICQKNESVL